MAPTTSPTKFNSQDYRVFVRNTMAFYDRWQEHLEKKDMHIPDLSREYAVGEAMLRLFDHLDKHRDAISKIIGGSNGAA